MTVLPWRTPPLTLRARVAVVSTAATLVVVAVVVVLVQILLGRALLRQLDDQLDAQADSLLLEVAGEDDTAEVVEELADLRLPPGRGIQVVDDDAQVVAARGEDAARSRLDGATVAGVLEGRRARGTVADADTDRRLSATGSAGTVVVVTESLDELEGIRLASLATLLPAGAVAAILAGLLGWFTASRGLRPLRRTADVAARVDLTRLDQRLPSPGSGDELGTLVAVLNDMLGRLQAAVERERRFTADASHELRTPLAILRGEIELARRRVDGRAGERLDSALEEADRLRGLIDDLLVLARVDADALDSSTPVDLGALAAATADRFTTLAGRRGVRVRAVGGTVLDGDLRALDRAIANLVDNAVRHAPDDGEVVVEVRDHDPGVVVEVRDDGPGVPDAELPRLFARFARPDDARTGGGAGLGLAIVAAVAEGHGGTATAHNRPAGGFSVTLELPRSIGTDQPVP